jgi:hypothetical protein
MQRRADAAAYPPFRTEAHAQAGTAAWLRFPEKKRYLISGQSRRNAIGFRAGHEWMEMTGIGDNGAGHHRFKTIVWWFAVAAALSLAIFVWRYFLQAEGLTTSVEDHRIYYRLVAKYQHGDEIIDFDIVAGCGVRVTAYAYGDTSYDAFRSPPFFVKATKEGAAIMQLVPSACAGETTENGRAPDDLLPGAVWFDSKDDLSLGIGYFTEDAYESQRSKLKFLGAEIHRVTPEEWEEFKPKLKENLLDPYPFGRLLPLPNMEDVKRLLGDSAGLSKLYPTIHCNVTARFEVTEPDDQELLRSYWPASQPRFWAVPTWKFREVFRRLKIRKNEMGDGTPGIFDYLDLAQFGAQAFPTRARGGRLNSKHKPSDFLPPTIFPLRRDYGVPWATPELVNAKIVHNDVDLGMQGFAYCFARLNLRGLHARGVGHLEIVTRVDGEPILDEVSGSTSRLDRPPPGFLSAISSSMNHNILVCSKGGPGHGHGKH